MSSSSKSSSKTSTDTQNADNRVAADNGAIVVKEGNVNITDGGAFEFAGDVIDGNFDVVGDTISEALRASEGIADLGAEIAFDAFGFAREVTDQNQDVLQDAFGFANDASDRNENIVNDALSFVGGNITDTNQLVDKIVDQQRSESTQLATQLMKLGIPAVALVLIAGALRK